MARSLVSQVALAVPPGVEMGFEGDRSVRLRLASQPPGEAVFDFALIANQPGHGTRIQNAATAVSAFLNFLQDFLILYTREPWPNPSRPLDNPSVTVRGRVIEGWFGEDPEASDALRVSVEVPDER